MRKTDAGRGVQDRTRLPVWTLGQIIEVLHRYDVEVGEATGRRFGAYIDMLLRWNAQVALTSITDPAEILERHFGESLFGARVAGIKGGRLLDVGSGGGFPAVPIVMVAPELEATLLEPNLKKAAFLRELCRSLELEGRVRVERSRIEEYIAKGRGFDFVTSRAVKVTAKFLERCAALLGPGGKVVMWAGLEDAVSQRGSSQWNWSRPVKVPGSERRVVLWGRRRWAGR